MLWPKFFLFWKKCVSRPIKSTTNVGCGLIFSFTLFCFKMGKQTLFKIFDKGSSVGRKGGLCHFSFARLFSETLIRSHPGKPNQRKASSWTFPGGIPEQKFDVNRACFPQEKHQNSQKWAKFMDFSFWPLLWFGLPGRLLTLGVVLPHLPCEIFRANSSPFLSIFPGISWTI